MSDKILTEIEYRNLMARIANLETMAIGITAIYAPEDTGDRTHKVMNRLLSDFVDSVHSFGNDTAEKPGFYYSNEINPPGDMKAN